ncbi:MAG: hypothetical protein NVS3B25_07210 [Hymenobacter sp.]
METRPPTPLKENINKLITPAEYARRNYVTPKTAYNRLRAGDIQGAKIGGRQFIKVD